MEMRGVNITGARVVCATTMMSRRKLVKIEKCEKVYYSRCDDDNLFIYILPRNRPNDPRE